MAEEMTSQAQTKQPTAKEGNFAAQPAENNQERGEFSASAREAGEYTAEEQQQQPENVGAFKAKEHEEEAPEKSPGYTPFDWGNESNVSDWLVNIFSGRLQDWFVANMQWAGHYVDKALNKVDKYIDRRDERKKLRDEASDKDKDGKDKGNKDKGPKDKDGKDEEAPDKDKDGKDKGNKDKGPKDKDGKDEEAPDKDKDGKDKGNKEKTGKDKDKDKNNSKKTSAQERNDHKAQKAQELADKAKKNMANRKYDNSALGKNQQAFDKMTVDSLQHEADFRKNVAANPDYAKSPEGRKARAELVGDRKALAAMQKETGVNNKIVDGNIKKKSNVKKAVQRAKIGLRAAGKTVNDQKKKVVNKVKQAHRKNMQKIKQKVNIKGLSNLKTQLKNAYRQKVQTPTRQRGNTMANAARKKQNAGR